MKKYFCAFAALCFLYALQINGYSDSRRSIATSDSENRISVEVKRDDSDILTINVKLYSALNNPQISQAEISVHWLATNASTNGIVTFENLGIASKMKLNGVQRESKTTDEFYANPSIVLRREPHATAISVVVKDIESEETKQITLRIPEANQKKQGTISF